MALLTLNFEKNVNFGHQNSHKSILTKNGVLVSTIVEIHHNVKLKTAKSQIQKEGKIDGFKDFLVFTYFKSSWTKNIKSNEVLLDGGLSYVSKQYLDSNKLYLDQKLQDLWTTFGSLKRKMTVTTKISTLQPMSKCSLCRVRRENMEKRSLGWFYLLRNQFTKPSRLIWF